MKLSGISTILFLIFTTTLSWTQSEQTATRYKVKVTYISDGDTFYGKDESGLKFKFRPIGFNCPEESNFGKPAEPFNEEATAYTTSMIMNKTVYVEYDVQKNDRWGRHLVYVYLEDGTMLNEEILKSGWAELATYPPNVKYVKRLRIAAREGRENKRGMFEN